MESVNHACAGGGLFWGRWCVRTGLRAASCLFSREKYVNDLLLCGGIAAVSVGEVAQKRLGLEPVVLAERLSDPE